MSCGRRLATSRLDTASCTNPQLPDALNHGTLLGAATVLAFAGIFCGAGAAVTRLLGPVR
jgi:hypothetical protein